MSSKRRIKGPIALLPVLQSLATPSKSSAEAFEITVVDVVTESGADDVAALVDYGDRVRALGVGPFRIGVEGASASWPTDAKRHTGLLGEDFGFFAESLTLRVRWRKG